MFQVGKAHVLLGVNKLAGHRRRIARMHTHAALQSNCKTQSCGELAAEPILHPDNVTGIDLIDQNATPVAGCGYFGETLVDGFLCEIELRQGYLNHTLAVDLVRKNGLIQADSVCLHHQQPVEVAFNNHISEQIPRALPGEIKNHIDESVLDRGFLVVVGEVELVFAGDRLARLAVDLLPQSQRVVDGFTDLAEVVEAQLFVQKHRKAVYQEGIELSERGFIGDLSQLVEIEPVFQEFPEGFQNIAFK